MMALEEMIYGPPPPGFTPTPSLGLAKGLPGQQSADNSVNSPAWTAYPANAVIYASKHRLPLVNDCLELPIPCVPGNVKDNAKALSTYLALEAVKLTFPKLHGVTAEEILQIRDTLRDDLRPFRIKMLELSSQLNTAISSATSASGIQRQAKFIADTRVLPELERVRRAVADTGRPWYKRLIDLTLDAPELAGNFFSMPPEVAIAKVFARIGKELVEIRDEHDQKRKILNGSGLGYLIKLEEIESG